MTELEFADKYFGKYSIRGSEIIPLYCPFCQGGAHRDKNTFALNYEKHTFNCKRGSCGVSGHFKQLCDKYGVKADMPDKPYEEYKMPERKTYKKPTTPITGLSETGLAYIKKRGITPETAAVFGITSDDKDNLVFPFYRTKDDYENKKPTFIKFRPARKVEKGEAKMWRERDTEPILFGLHLCRPAKRLYICEGEFDCMTIYQVTGGGINIVSVPSGAEDFTWVETCAEELKQYTEIVIVGDADAAGQKMANDIYNKFPDKAIFVIDYAKYRGCKDANELAFRYGAEAVVELIASAKKREVEGLINISDVVPVDYMQIGRVLTGIPPLDRTLGGMFYGDITIVSGKRGEGKSALLNQIAVQAVDQGVNVCVYSGEIPKDRFKYQLMLPAAGYLNIDEVTDPKTGRLNYIIKPEVVPLIEKWLDRRVWLYDNDQIQIDERENIIRLFTKAFAQYDCRVFIVDNLMTVNIGAKANEVLYTQAEFVIQLRKFAAKYGVHVFCVVHPRKGDGKVGDSDDVAGLSMITDIACNVLVMHRCKEQERNELNCDAILKIYKNRAFGDVGDIPLMFDQRSRTFFKKYETNKPLSWQKEVNTHE